MPACKARDLTGRCFQVGRLKANKSLYVGVQILNAENLYFVYGLVTCMVALISCRGRAHSIGTLFFVDRLGLSCDSSARQPSPDIIRRA